MPCTSRESPSGGVLGSVGTVLKGAKGVSAFREGRARRLGFASRSSMLPDSMSRALAMRRRAESRKTGKLEKPGKAGKGGARGLLRFVGNGQARRGDRGRSFSCGARRPGERTFVRRSFLKTGATSPRPWPCSVRRFFPLQSAPSGTGQSARRFRQSGEAARRSGAKDENPLRRRFPEGMDHAGTWWIQRLW